MTLRKRELQLYLPHCDPTSEDASQLEILTCLAQLTALQLSATRAVFSLSDCKSQYVVAETPPSSCPDNQGERTCDMATPCDHAMNAFVDDTQGHFVVADLAQDSRFVSYRKTFHNDRFYVAVPMKTPAGIVIGCVEVYGDTAREKADEEELQLLVDRAGAVMGYLARLRTMREGRHGEKMIKALGVFVEAETRTRDGPASASTGSSRSREKQSPMAESPSGTGPDPIASIQLANSRKKLDIPPAHIPQTELGVPLRGRPKSYRSRSPPRKIKEGSSIPEDTCCVLQRACDLIRNALDVDGVAFLDISPFNQERHGVSPNFSSKSRSRSRDADGDEHSSGEMYACSVSENDNQPIAVPTLLLRDLVLRYARGGIFHSNEDKDELTPLGDENHSSNNVFSSAVEDRTTYDLGYDMRKISHVFSGSNSVAFFPLWDYQQTRWFAGCFIWTKDPRRAFTESKDLTYLAAFNNSVMAEVLRLDLRAADREKADFISSVSHEWRSPLHGILNMLDILKGTKLTTVQQYLLDITTNCVKTLADTVNHVLDYGKINSLIGPTSQGQIEPGSSEQDSPFQVPALINQVNMATLVEEVAGALLASQDYLGPNAEALFSAAEQSVDRPFLESNIPNTTARAVFAIVDVEWRPNWECSVSAGAWRRILLNLFGNALKFTRSGFVQLKLRRDDTLNVKTLVGSSEDHQHPAPAILLQISDSGRGISPDFLSNLYTPFQQEDSLSTGMGVGLNIVYRIVDSLNGRIDLRSEPERGTVVSVLLPVTMVEPSSSSPLPVPYASLREKLAGKTVSLFPNSSKYGDLHIDPEVFDAILTSMGTMITEWFGVRVLPAKATDKADSNDYNNDNNNNEGEAADDTADIIIVTEHEYDSTSANKDTALYDRYSSSRKHPARQFPVIVLCKHAHSWLRKPPDPREPVVFLQQPISPRTLAVALTSCLEQRMPSPSELSSGDAEDRDGKSLIRNKTTVLSGESREIELAEHTKTQPSDTQAYDTQAHHATPASCNHTAQRCKVLLVEDNDLNLKILESTMHKAGFAYESAMNGLEAVQKVESEGESGTFHAIIMDLSMPVMDGVTAIRKIREYENEIEKKKRQSIPTPTHPVTIIALTAVGTPAMKKDALDSGADYFLTKPANMMQLKKLLPNLVA
ncbi:hypothetical protein BJX70DRAFT_357376 [Aspergillus crustosus]